MIKKLSIAILLSLGIPAIACAQVETAETPAVPAATQTQTAKVSGFSGSGGLFGQSSPEDDAARKLRKRIQSATDAFRNAEGSARIDAEKELETALSEEYDLRLTEYDKYLDRLEKQLSEMRKKLDRRRDAKRDMVQLRIQVLAAEADDLGWPSATPGRRTLWSSGQSGLIYAPKADPFAEAATTISGGSGGR